MNTKTLRDKNKGIYDNFSAKHQILYSIPFIMSWTGDIDSKYNWISIKQKTPLRMYIGINLESTPGIHFWNIIYRDTSEHKFLEVPLIEYAPYFGDILDYIKNSNIPFEKWYRITILSELPRWVGMWFDSLFCLLVSISIYRFQNWFSLNDLDTSNIREDINNPNTLLYKVIRYAHLLESQIKWYNYISGNIATALCPGKFPIVNFTEDIQNSGKKELVSNNDYKYFIYPVQELFPDTKTIPYSPIDYWVIYSGRPTLTEHTSHDNQKEEADSIIAFIDSTFKWHISHVSASKKPRFYKEIIKNYAINDENTIASLLWYNSFEVLQKLKNVLEKWFSEEDIKKLLLAITKVRYAHNALKRSSSHLSSLITCLQQYFWHRPDLLWISYNDSNVMWWSLFFVTPIEWLRKNIINTIHQTQLNFPWTDLLYANRLDGIEENWLICEQDLAEKKRSSYIDTNSLVLELSNNNCLFGTHEQLTKSNQADVILDTINGKIYIAWEKITSKNLHSQTATVDLFLKLLHNTWSDISNRQLVISSYTRSKNEMLGKIVLPLTKLIKEKLQKDLCIECYGAMYDYFIRLNKTQVTFWVVKKIMEFELVV